MKKRLLILSFILFALVNFSAFGQTYNMANGTFTPACSGTFYDPGGLGNYANNTGLITMTFCSGSGDEVVLDFSGFPFQVETGFDFFNIYDGVGTGGANLWNSQTAGGTINPGVITSSTGCLTITFSSDGSVTYSGWQASISCFTPTPPTCVDGIMNGLETGIDCGGPACPACPDCNNGIQDGNETDVDCGGACAPCPTPCSVIITDVVVGPAIDCNGGDVQLTADGVGSFEYVLYNDFNTGAAGTGWSSTGGAAFGEPCGSNPTASPYYWASTSIGTPQLTTIPFDVSCGGVVTFDMSYATQGGASPCEGPDLPNEGVTFQYSTNGGITWTTIQYWDPVGGYDPILTSWNTYSFPIPPGAMTPNTTFQWIQNNSSGACCDNWGIDNVSITSLLDCTPYWYDWSQIPGSPDAAVQNETVVTTTTYIVTYTNGIDACYDTVTFVVPLGSTADAGPDQVYCLGSPGVVIGLDPVCPDNGATFSWDNGGGSGTIDLIPAGGTTNGQGSVSPAATTTYEVTVDFNGCQVTDQVTVIVDAPPTASNPANINVQCSGDVPAVNTNVVTDEADDFTTPPAVTHVGDVSDGLTCPETITRTYRVTDGCGSFVDVTQLIIIDDTQIPIMNVAPGVLAVQCAGDVPAMTNLDWTDNCDGTGSAAGNDISDGLSCPETITRTWTYTDACGNTSIAATQTITVNDTQVPVFAAPPANVTVECAGDIPAMTSLGWTDNCDGAANVAGADGALVGGPCGGTITRTWTYTDACGNNATVTQTITVDDTTPPTATSPLPQLFIPPAFDPLQVTDEADNCGVPTVTNGGDVSDGGNCPEIITRTYIITDACGNSTNVTQTFTVEDLIPPTASNPLSVLVQCVGDVPLADPTVVTDEADNGDLATVTWEDDTSDGLSCPETILRRYRVTDECGNFIFVTQIITVHDTKAPVFLAPPVAANVQCIGDLPAMIDLAYTDNCDAAGAVSGSDVSDGLICPETITRTWTYTDACGNNATETQTITVQDTQVPVFSAPPAALTVECIADVPAMIDLGWTDNCDGAGTVTGADGALTGGACGGTITRTWTYTDACGNNAIVTQTITVDDTTLPTASNPATTTVLGGSAPAVDITVVLDEADNCTVNPVVAFVSEVSDINPCSETITRIYSVTDDCGNTINLTHLIVITDTLPTGTAPATVNVECSGDVPSADPLLIIDEADNQGVPVVAFVGDVSDGLSCPETITRTYSITDLCGNVVLVTQLIIVNDVTNPTGVAPANVNVECIGDVPASNILDITNEADNCTLNPVVAFVGDVSDGLSCPETITRTYSITDDCGNQITVDQLIIVNDVTNPTGTAPATVNVECIGDVPVNNPLSITNEADNCTANPVVAFVGDVSNGLSCPETITRTYSITDDCGNQITVDQLIIVNDVTPPTASNPAPISVPGSNDVPLPNPLVVIDELDNCTVNPVVVWVSDISDGNVCNLEKITRTYSVTDDCGNQIFVTHEITIAAVPVPIDAGPDQSICEGDLTTITANIPLGGVTILWDPVVPVGPFSPSVTTTYTVTADNEGCISTDDVDVTVNPLPTAIIGTDVTVCLGDIAPTITFTGANGTAPYTFTYNINGGANTTVISVGNIATVTAPTAVDGTFAYNLVSVSDNSVTLCSQAQVGIATIIVNPLPTATIGTDVTVCLGDVAPTITFTGANGTAPYTFTYNINGGANTTVTSVGNIATITAPTGVDGTFAYNLVSISDNSANSCSQAQVGIATIIVNPLPTATIGTDVTLCQGDFAPTITFTGANGTAPYTFTYNINGGANITVTALTNVFVAPFTTAVAGTFVFNLVSVSDASVSSCSQAQVGTATVIINPTPTVDPIADDALCANDATLGVVFTSGTAGTIFDWTNSLTSIGLGAYGSVDIASFTGLNVSATPSIATITVTPSLAGCAGNPEIFTITINPLPTVFAGNDFTVCEGNQAVLTASGAFGYVWTAPVIDGVAFTPLVTGNYFVTGTDANGCIGTDDVTVTVEEVPIVSFVGDILSGCAPLEVTFTNTTPGITSDCVWSIGGVPYTGCTVTTSLGVGLYDVTLETTNDVGCSSLLTYTDYIYVEAVPLAQFTPSQTQMTNIFTEVVFTNNSVNATDYLWTMGDGTPSSTSINTTHTFPSDPVGSYLIELVAMSPLGCADTAWVTVNVSEEIIYYIPNTFTPDGDKYNEYFKPIFTSGYDPYDFDLFIFNRWGETIWESHDSSIGWDGTYGVSGKLVQNGTYTWRIEFKTIETDERILVTGHVNVLD